MSEFEQNWPISEDIRDHERYIAHGVSELNGRMILPQDGRWEIAYGALAMGDQKAAVLAEGDPGTGKTQFGNHIMGQDVRTDIAATDTPETLEGYLRPTDGKYNRGKMVLDPEEMRLFLNEISHLRDTGPLHKYWDGSELDINGTKYPLEAASIYATTNFANGARAKRLDDALRSRMGITVLAGDDARAIAAYVQGIDVANKPASVEGGMLPPAKARMQIRNGLQSAYPLHREAGQYMTDVIANLNDSGLFTRINESDARTGQGWQQAVRARRFVEGGIDSTDSSVAIRARDLARVAPLALGSVAFLGHHGTSELSAALGKNEMTPLEKAVVARRVVAAIAMKTIFDNDPLEKVSESDVAKHMDHYSYANAANADEINGVVIERVLGNAPVTPEAQDAPKSRKLSRFFTRG